MKTDPTTPWLFLGTDVSGKAAWGWAAIFSTILEIAYCSVTRTWITLSPSPNGYRRGAGVMEITGILKSVEVLG
jgi:hypothetical protein